MLPLPVSPALDFFLQKINAYDVSLAKVNYQMERQVVEKKYSFYGVFIPHDEERIQFDQQGEIFRHTCSIFVPSKIKFYFSKEKFSVFEVNGTEYRICGLEDRTSDGRYRKCIGKRYLEERL